MASARKRWRLLSSRGRRRLAAAGVPALPVSPLLSALLVAAATAGAPTLAGAQRAVAAPAYRPLAYPAPQPGTYELPPLGRAGDGVVLDTEGRPRRLAELYSDQLVLLSFIYTSCRQSEGCPMASFVLGRVGTAVAADSELADEVRLVTLSFDPARDTPAVMRRYAERVAGGSDADWVFLTTASGAELAPILETYGQSVTRDRDESGRERGTISHVLRVFLIDQERRIRNVYSSSFLHADTVLADLRTLEMERSTASGLPDAELSARPREAAAHAAISLHGAGDAKDGYEARNYHSRSKGLASRDGEAADLMALLAEPPLGLPPVPVPADNPVTAAKVALGRKLFFDRRLSRNRTLSCAMCHIPEQGFTSHEMATAVGIEGRTVRRNAPTIYNVGHARLLFHDGRERLLEQQIWGPLLAVNEMGNPSVGFVLDTLAALPDYAGLFEAAFDGRGPTMETLGMALASYQRTLVSGNSPFDRWHYGEDHAAISEAAARGHELFTGKAHCSRCHTIGAKRALFTDHDLHDTGIGYRHSMQPSSQPRRVQLAPGVFVDLDRSAIDAASPSRPSDLGRYEITEDPSDRWKYRTPGLRNVTLTAPYMHDGSLPTLRDVVEFYDVGGVEHELLDPAITPLGLETSEIDDLVAFLETLTGDSVELILTDAFAAPVGDPR